MITTPPLTAPLAAPPRVTPPLAASSARAAPPSSSSPSGLYFAGSSASSRAATSSSSSSTTMASSSGLYFAGSSGSSRAPSSVAPRTVDRIPRVPPARLAPIQRVHLTNAQKLELCEYSAANPSLSLEDLALWTKKRFRLKKPVATTTVYRALRRRDQLAQMTPRELEGMTVRQSSVYAVFETRLRDWIVEMADRGLHLDCKIIQAEAQRLRVELDHDGEFANHSFSNGWFASFMLRHDLSLTELRKRGTIVAPNRPRRVNKKRAAPTATAMGHPTY